MEIEPGRDQADHLDDVVDPRSALREILRLSFPRSVLGLDSGDLGLAPIRWELVGAAMKSGPIDVQLPYDRFKAVLREIETCPSTIVRDDLLETLDAWVGTMGTAAIPDIADEAFDMFRASGHPSYRLREFLIHYPFLRSDRSLVARAIDEVIAQYDERSSCLTGLSEFKGAPEDAVRLHQGLLSGRHALRLDEDLAILLHDWSGGSPWGQFQYQLWRPDQIGEHALRPVEGSIASLVSELKRLPLEVRNAHADVNLLTLSPQSRASWRRSLKRASQPLPDLTETVVEAVLRLTSNDGDELALFTVIELLSPDKFAVLGRMIARPMPLVALRAAAALDLSLGEEGAADLLMRTRGSLEANPPERPSGTWIGDPVTESVLHEAFATAARELAEEMRRTVDSGEESHVAILFERLRNEARSATRRLAAIAREGGRNERVDVSLERRIIGHTEEGAEGLAAGRAFSTDVCLLFSACRNGRTFAQRASLIQAKRLKRQGALLDELYTVDMDQMKDIAEQSAASFLLLAGPMVDNVTIPIVPARLLMEFLGAESGSRTLRPQLASRLGRSLAPWLLSQVVGLWTGDAREEVIEKAMGSETGRPTTVLELTVSVVPTSEEMS